jgi:hypothetical protein
MADRSIGADFAFQVAVALTADLRPPSRRLGFGNSKRATTDAMVFHTLRFVKPAFAAISATLNPRARGPCRTRNSVRVCRGSSFDPLNGVGRRRFDRPNELFQDCRMWFTLRLTCTEKPFGLASLLSRFWEECGLASSRRWTGWSNCSLTMVGRHHLVTLTPKDRSRTQGSVGAHRFWPAP